MLTARDVSLVISSQVVFEHPKVEKRGEGRGGEETSPEEDTSTYSSINSISFAVKQQL